MKDFLCGSNGWKRKGWACSEHDFPLLGGCVIVSSLTTLSGLVFPSVFASDVIQDRDKAGKFFMLVC